MKLVLFFGITSAILLLACRKEKSNENPFVICGYTPYSNGSFFTFENVTSNRDTVDYTLTVKGDTLVNGDTYAKLVHDSFTVYIRCDNGHSYQFMPSINLPGYQLQPKANRFLIEDKPLGGTWSDTILLTVSGLKQMGLLQYSIVEKGITKTVYGREFQNVIGVKQDAAFIIGGTAVPVGTLAVNYYALHIGPIQIDKENDTTRLKDYTIL